MHTANPSFAEATARKGGTRRDDQPVRAPPQPCPELVAAADLDLAAAHVALGDLDAAGGCLAEVFALPVERRTVPVARRAAGIGEALAAPALTASPQSADLREQQLDLFLAYPATRELPA